MTTAELKAGRELDALVAEKVMGWKRLPGNWRGIIWADPQYPATGTIRSEEHFEASTDPGAAWKVVEAMRAKGWDYEIGSEDTGDSVYCEFSKDKSEGHVYETTMPEAVCRAALAAVGAA